MEIDNKKTDIIRYKLLLINLLKLREKSFSKEFFESDELLISQLESNELNIDEKLLEYLYIYLFTHDDSLNISEIKYNSEKKNFLLMSIDHNDNKIVGKMEQISLIEDELMSIKKETSIFEKTIDNKYKAWKEISFSTPSAIELIKLYTELVTSEKEKKPIGEVGAILRKEPYSTMIYRRLVTLGIAEVIKDGKVKTFYNSPDNNITDILKDNLEEISEEKVNSMNEEFWNECKKQLNDKYYGYPKEIRNLINKAIDYQRYNKDENIVEETYDSYNSFLNNGEIDKKYLDDKIDDDLNKFMILMEEM